MNKTFKKLLSGILTASMIFGTLVLPQTAMAVTDDDLLVDITFDEAGTGTGTFTATKGGSIKEYGSVDYVDTYAGNKALSISTNAAGNYLELPQGILNGKTAATVSFMIKPSNGWAYMTTPVATQTYLSEKYLGILATDTAITAERYNNSGSRLSTTSATGSYNIWQHVAAVYEADSVKIYINGELKASHSAAVDISALFTADASTWIGHGNWGSGEGFSGMIDDYKIYGTALDADEVAALAAEYDDYSKKALLYENDCYEFETTFTDSSDNELFAVGSSQTVNAVTTIRNYKGADETFTAELYSFNASGAKTKLDETSSSASVASGAEANITLTASSVPSDCSKLVLEITTQTADETYDAATLYGGIQAPVAAPADSNNTTNGAHDPSIVKFPNDDKYYVYSSHHLIFTSEDLINWRKYDFTNIDAKNISPKTYNFINSNYSNTTMNGTYWAPDVIYREGDEHPYWMYISVSCGLGGRNSAIVLMKSSSPLFWADNKADIIDAGIVFATKENSAYKTNAIDANIYTDSNDGKQYFVWGSFWGGIQAAPLTSEGFVEGINYDSDATILSSCQNFGTSVFTQRNGAAGPEGAWMINHGDYRYMFTSYGWLGSNYNTRVARAPLSVSFSTNMNTQLVDANGVVMGTQQTQGSTSKLTGYKLIGSYRLGDGTMTITHDTSNNEYYYARGAGDAHVYYGPGHNSAINIGDESFYVSHTRKDAIEGAATLQVRKMLFTSDGWPVVSPVTYAGEVEQALPKDMLLGTYDLASVGQTKMQGSSIYTGTNPNRNYDLPVLSSKVTLNENGTLGSGLGTWTFDGDHTVTLTFAKDGDTSADEFYKSGDVMTLYALFGYDKDEKEPVIALTGVDQNHVTQFAKKAVTNIYQTAEVPETAPIVLEKSKGNPVLGFDANGSTLYAGDPAALVDGDTVYLYAGHDTSTGSGYRMPEWVCYSSKDMKEWKYEGVTLSASSISWRVNDTTAWASQVIKHGDTYYMYYCTTNKNASNYHSIGVATSSSPTGPFTDIGAPLVNGRTQTTENSSDYNDIDPTVWVETVDGVEHRYLAWGNNILYVCELNEDMTSVKDLNGDGQITAGDDIKTQVFKSLPGAGFTEAPWIYRRQDENGNYYGKYYIFGAFGWREQMGYVVSDSMYGPWEAGGILMPPTATSNTNHPAVIDFKGHTYFIYHNGSLPWGSGYRRVVCIEEFTINEDGTIDPIPETSTGITGTASVIKQGEDFLFHENFVNPSSDDYPITATVSVGQSMQDMADIQWEIVQGKDDKNNEYYVSIQSVNKPGLYLQANNDKSVVLTQDDTQDTDGSVKTKMTFKTVSGLDGSEDGVSFESVSQPGYYLTKDGSNVKLTRGTKANLATFMISAAEDIKPPAMAATITELKYETGTAAHFILNNAKLYDTVNAYVAEYDSADTLIGVAAKTNIKVTSAAQTIDIDYERKAEDSTLRLYVWKDMLPVAPAANITETIAKYVIPEGYTSYFPFDEDSRDKIAGLNAVMANTNIDGASITSEPTQADGGYKGKAAQFTGAGSYGLNLGNVITNNSYTISFRMKANAFTQHTSAVFIDSGSKSSENWLSAPFAQQTGGGTAFWSNKGSGNHTAHNSSTILSANEWYQITITSDNGSVKMYIDGIEAVSGNAVNTIDANTNTYLGINYWDTPFNGLIDEVYIYNGKVLTDDEVVSLYNATR